jgi:hypothetical protein
MKKQIALILAMLFIGAGVAGAADFSLTGNYTVEGDYLNFSQWTAYQSTGNMTDYAKARGYGIYTHELSVDATIAMSEATNIFARFEMRDEDWGAPGRSSESVYTTQPDDNIAVEQLIGTHTFGNGSSLAVGLMPATFWGTTFNDNITEAYRVKYTVPTSVGTFVGVLEKGAENGSPTNGEDTDTDTYLLAAITKLGNVYVKPAVAYKVVSNPVPAAELDVKIAMLALDGTFGNIGFEAEGDYYSIDKNQGTDYATYGLYANVWLTQDALKAGVLGAYGSYDGDANVGFDFGDDFDAGGALIMGNHISFMDSSAATPNQDLTAGRLIAAYFDYALSEKLSLGGYLGHATCGVSNNSIWDGANVSEISGDITYKITPNLNYTFAAGTAKFSWGNSTVDPETAVLVSNSLSFSF